MTGNAYLSITVRLTSSLSALTSGALLHNYIYVFGCSQSSQTGGQLYSDTFPYDVSTYFAQLNEKSNGKENYRDNF